MPDRPAASSEAPAIPTDSPYLAILGIAQDGGVPQTGHHDDPAWEDPSLQRKVVSLGLVDPVHDRRYLFEATPDLPEQLRALDRLAPRPRTAVPVIDGVFLTHAHMGHYTGLMFLGHESLGARDVPIYAMPRMSDYLRRNGPWDQLVRYDNIVLEPLEEGRPVELGPALRVTAFSVPHRQEYSEVVGYRIDGPSRSVLFLPDIDSFEAWERLGVRIEDRIAEVDFALLDGAFWDQGEIPGRDMSEFPHPMIAQTIERLAALPPEERAKVLFVHLNHSNPALRADSAERAEIEAAGFAVANEGDLLPL